MPNLAALLLFADIVFSKHFLIETEGGNWIQFSFYIFPKDSLSRKYAADYEYGGPKDDYEDGKTAKMTSWG